MQVRGIPDILGCIRGRHFGIEVKVPGEESTDLQKFVQQEIRDAGGIAGEAHSVTEALALLGEEPSSVRGRTDVRLPGEGGARQ